ncbi:MAG: hypothetical protein ACOWWM_15425 [Desulfobacterales bacterium]
MTAARQLALPMAEPTYRVETNSRGVHVLYVTYDPVRLDWNESIADALKDSGLNRREAVIICEPRGGLLRVLN